MPTSINLKDITISDNQASLSEKINYNFNQLKSLGIGGLGPVGPTGGLGSPGPKGLIGDAGIRGTRWYSFSDLGLSSITKPTDVGFTIPTGFDLQYGDLYTTGLFDVFEYRNIPGVNKWVQVINHNNLVNTTNLQASLVRNFSVSGTDPNSERFISFIKYNGSDRTTTSANPYYNDILFLHNFDQSQVLTDFAGSNIITNFYTSLQTIYVDHSISSGDLQVRNHMEFGSFYKVGQLFKITKNNENLKLKYKLDGDIRLVQMNVSKNDGDASTLGAFNSAFKFSISKYVNTTHHTIDFALSSTETVRKYTDLNFELIDGFTINRNSSKIGVGIKESPGGVKSLALIGSTGTGSIEQVYSNLPINQFGTMVNTVQFTAFSLDFIGIGDNFINSTNRNLKIFSGRGESINLINNSLEISVNNGLQGIVLSTNGKIGIGKRTIVAVTDTVPATSTLTPTANLMVNGSFGAGIRRVTSNSSSGNMVLTDTDTSVIIGALPVGSSAFELGAPSNSTLRYVVIANTTSTTISILSNTSTIGSLIAYQTALYQSFGSQWILLMTSSNVLASSGGGIAGIWAIMSLINIRENTTTNGTNTISNRHADLQLTFYSNINCTLEVPVNQIQVRVKSIDRLTSNGTTNTPITSTIFATANGGNPHVLFPGVLLNTTQVDNQQNAITSSRNIEYVLQSSASVPPDCFISNDAGETTVLSYKKRGEV